MRRKSLFPMALRCFLMGCFVVGSFMISEISVMAAPMSLESEGIPDSGKALVYDGAGILLPSDIEELTSRLIEINGKHDVKLVIATTENTGKRTDEEFADDYYDDNGYNEDGALLLINMNTKGWHISTKGKGISSFSDYGIQCIGSIIRPDLSAGNFGAAFNKFINTADKFLTQAETGTPYDEENPYKENASAPSIILAMAALALAISLIIVRILAAKMNTVRRQSGAVAYAKDLVLTEQRDTYLYSRTTSRRIESTSSGGGSGGSSTHTSSSGSTHGGGGGRF